MDSQSLWLRLSRMPGATIQNLQLVLDSFESIEALFGASRAQLENIFPARAALVEALCSEDHAEKLEQDFEWLQHDNNYLVPFTDDRYPPLLLQSSGAPACLFVTGDINALCLPQLAVVGSRNPSASGKDNARAFTSVLAGSGLAITSGLAQGIDAVAHEAAIAAGGKTIAVMGTGLQRVYPSANRDLAHAVAGHGALVSEFPLDAPPRRENFPRRNRVIAALSLGTLVVEAAVKSGSLITARLAGENGREVFAIPGSIHSALAKGCHRLIKQGAKLVETANDVIEELEPMVGVLRQQVQKQGKQAQAVPPEFAELLDIIGYDPVDINQLVERSGLTAEVISSMLLKMELEGVVETGPGGKYQRSVNVVATH
ncbi:MAG: DNA-processing protein DprA [Acidiferrobacterales bacterium]|nr:DNA-processing protein DprA [Acidiferrobacterales bacterium]